MINSGHISSSRCVPGPIWVEFVWMCGCVDAGRGGVGWSECGEPKGVWREGLELEGVLGVRVRPRSSHGPPRRDSLFPRIKSS